jgi:exopolysaccharide biosynthesis polyprenyl glycosylphosphotransferase
MHSSIGLGTPPQPSPNESLPVPLRLVEPADRSSAAVHFRRIVLVCEVIGDVLTVTLAVLLAYVIYGESGLGKQIHYSAKTILTVAVGFALVLVLMLDRAGAYRLGNSLLRVRETEHVLRVSVESFLIAMAVSFFTNVLFARWLLVLCLVLVPLLLVLEKSLAYLILRLLHSRGYGNERVIIYGSGSTGRRVFSVLKRSPKLGLQPLAFVDDDPAKAGSAVFELGYERRQFAPVVRGPLTRDLIDSYKADMVIVAIPSIAREAFIRTLDEALGASARISFVPGHLVPSDPWVGYQDIDGVLLASFRKPTLRVGYQVVKRLCDFFGSLVLLVLASPLLLLLALIIKLDSRGAVLFRQERVGRIGKLFQMYKFRTMHASAAPYDYSPGSPGDPRITRVGKFLRRTSLDELPQLFNVLRGNMSLVGPRPEMTFIVERYTERQMQRLEVKPGITGLWQLSGDRVFQIHENIEYDLYYIQHRNFFMDLAILLHTSVFAMRGI